MNNKFFQSQFGLNTKSKVTNLSANVVSVLQAGAFFGSILSAPISNKIGRKWALESFTVIFCVGAVRLTLHFGQYPSDFAIFTRLLPPSRVDRAA